MTTNKKTSRDKLNDSARKRKSFKIHQDIIAIALIGLSILALVSFFTEKTGIVGNSLKHILYVLFGTGSYVFPFLLILLSILLLIDKNNKYKFSSLTVLFLSTLIIFDSSNDVSFNFIENIRKVFSGNFI